MSTTKSNTDHVSVRMPEKGSTANTARNSKAGRILRPTIQKTIKALQEQGWRSAVTAAKNTILYAIVGLIVAFVAYAAVNFVISAIAPGSGLGGGGTNV